MTLWGDVLTVTMIAGSDTATKEFQAELMQASTCCEFRLNVAENRSEARALLAEPCHIAVLSGHGYRGDERDPWSLGGRSRARLRASDFPEHLPAQFLVLDACYSDEFASTWKAATLRRGTTVVYGSVEPPNEVVRRNQWRRVLRFVETVAAVGGSGLSTSSLREAWCDLSANCEHDPDCPPYRIWPEAPSNARSQPR